MMQIEELDNQVGGGDRDARATNIENWLHIPVDEIEREKWLRIPVTEIFESQGQGWGEGSRTGPAGRMAQPQAKPNAHRDPVRADPCFSPILPKPASTL